jgi:dipeptidyl aminopeptidase/acylaminoacyl peptidase
VRSFLVSFFLLFNMTAGWCQLVKDEPLSSVHGVNVRQWSYRSSDRILVKGLLFSPFVRQGSTAKMPIVVFCHDGISGISREHRLASARLARSGLIVFAPSYRGEDGSEGIVEVAKGEVDDVLAAVPLLQQLKHADAKQVALAGASHGALIAALAAARSQDVRAAVLAYGVMDIYRWWDYLKLAHKLGGDRVTARTYGDGPEQRPLSFRMRNALGVVDHIRCPVLLLQGGKDDIVPAEQAREMKRAMDSAGKSCQLQLYPDCLHGFLVYAPYLSHGVTAAERRQTESAWSLMLAFLHRSLKQ